MELLIITMYDQKACDDLKNTLRFAIKRNMVRLSDTGYGYSWAALR